MRNLRQATESFHGIHRSDKVMPVSVQTQENKSEGVMKKNGTALRSCLIRQQVSKRCTQDSGVFRGSPVRLSTAPSDDI